VHLRANVALNIIAVATSDLARNSDDYDKVVI